MEAIGINMDEICALLRKTLAWLAQVEGVPLTYVGENRGRAATRRRPLLEFAYQASGVETEVRAGEAVARSRPGTFMVLNAHFGNEARPAGPWSYWCLSLDVSDADEMKGVGDRPFVWGVHLGESEMLAGRYRRLERVREGRDALQTIRLKVVVMELLLALHDQLPGPESAGRPGSRAVEEAILCIHRDYRQHDLSLADIARSSGRSVAHFGRLFRRETGRTPMKYLTRHRIERAQELLKRTDLQVGEVGFAVGFTDRLHFSRVFRRYVGASPRAFRKGLQEDRVGTT